MTLTNPELKALNSPGVYQMCAAVHRTVARRHGVSPGTVQATIWAWYRNDLAYHPVADDPRNNGWTPDAHLAF